MHTILGAGGSTANELTKELLKNKETIRLVSRRPVETQGQNISWKKADLLSYPETLEAAKGSAVIYICNGVGYTNEDWKKQWPVIMQNVINAGKETGARIIFLDNVYMYGRATGPMTESTPYNPCSVKGGVRAQIATQFMEEVKAGNIRGSIARAPGFYGTDSLQSSFDVTVLNKYSKHQRAMWLGDPEYTRNFGYMPDIGKALYLLGQHPETDNEVWHTPTAPPLKGIEFIEMAASIYGVPAKYTRIYRWMLRTMGLFDKAAASQVEMYYIWEQHFDFVSAKFEKAFDIRPTSFEAGIRQLSQSLYKAQIR
jgi:nucleoside-diphosphate-sugar epimerase